MTVIQAELTRPEHAEALLRLLDSYARDPAGGGKGLSAYAKQNLVPSLQRRNDVVAVLAFAKQTPVGLALCFEGFSSFLCRPLLNIHDLVVSQAFRGQGVSQKMLQAVESIAKQRGYCKLTLEVLAGNLAAQAAYKKFGFNAYELDPNMGQALFWEKVLV